MKKIFRQFKKLFLKQPRDYTCYLYILRVLSFILTWLYAIFTLFNRDKRINFHSNKNFIRKFYLEQLNDHDKILNIAFNKKFLKNGNYDFNGIILPPTNDTTTLRFIYKDVLSIYTEHNDDYNVPIH